MLPTLLLRRSEIILARQRVQAMFPA